MRFGGMVLAAMLLLGACSSEPAPKEPTATPSKSSATPTRAVPTMPPQATEDSDAGAAAFVKHYVDVFNYAAATGDVAELTRLSSPDCDGCQSYIKLYKDTYEAGGYFKDSDWQLGDIELEFTGNTVDAFARATSSPGVRRDSRKSPIVPGDAEDTELVFTIAGRPGHRLISRLERAGV